jgi:hypothetical protein
MKLQSNHVLSKHLLFAIWFDHFNLVCIEIVEKIVKLLYILFESHWLVTGRGLVLTLSQTRASIFRHARPVIILILAAGTSLERYPPKNETSLHCEMDHK